MSTLTMDTGMSRSNLPRWVALLALALIALIWGGMYLRDNLPNGQSVMFMGASTGCNTVYGSTPPSNPSPASNSPAT